MKILNEYNKAKQAIYDHVGFKEDWVTYPINDCTDMFWQIRENKDVKYANTIKEFNSDNEDYYIDDIYTQRFYDKWIYKGKQFTMIFCDPHVDGMKYFRIFDNKMRVTVNE